MNIETLRTKVSGVIDSKKCGAEFYFLLGAGDSFTLRRADLTSEARTGLTDSFVEALRSAMNVSSIIGISAADERRDCIYHYDIGHVPEQLLQLAAVLDASGDEFGRFEFSRESVKLLKGIIVLLGNGDKQLAVYRHHYPIFLFEKNSGLFTGLAEGRLHPLEDDVLRISPIVDFLCVGGEYFIFNLKLLERSFGFQEAIRSLATKGLQSIAASGLIADAAVLQERMDDMTFARKLAKAAEASPVLNKVPNKDIVAFIQSHPGVRGRIPVDEENTKLMLTTKASQDIFLKLLNDDFLQSELTRRYYASLAKDARNTLAPIVLFVYNRPWQTEQTVTVLLKNELAVASDLIVYPDAPKKATPTYPARPRGQACTNVVNDKEERR